MNKSTLIRFRCTPDERQRIEKMAADSGRCLSDYCREQAIKGEIKAIRKLSTREQEFFQALKTHNINFARLSNMVKYKDPTLYAAI